MQRPEIFTRDVELEKNDQLGTMNTSDHHGIKISGFTPSYEALGRLLKEDDDENSDFAYESCLVTIAANQDTADFCDSSTVELNINSGLTYFLLSTLLVLTPTMAG